MTLANGTIPQILGMSDRDWSSWASRSNFSPLQADLRPLWHQLIVIGNGFDLECGLASSFADFIRARNLAFEDEENGKDNRYGFTGTIWDAILESLGDVNWCDVEGAISKWLVSEEDAGSGEKDDDNCLSRPLIDDVADALRQLGRDWGAAPQSSAASIAYHLVGCPEEAKGWTKEKLLTVSKNDLRTLEKDFASYLRKTASCNASYEENAQRLIRDIVDDERPNDDELDIKQSILSFNYTHPELSLSFDGDESAYVNIHGRLGEVAGSNEEIVFGIDGTGLMGNPDILPFTKTYRIMGLNSADTRKFIHSAHESGFPDYGTTVIKFYGHSLGRADYSYFQAIFDSVHLYEGQTRLVFYYRRHSKGEISSVELAKELEGIKTRTMQRVISLLVAYGETLDNRDHGKNLIHKLLIEGRLAVLELPSIA